MTTLLGTDLIVIVLTALATFVALHAWDYRSSRIFVIVVATLILMNILTSVRPSVDDPAIGYVLASMSLSALVVLITALMLLTSALFAPQWWTGARPIRLIVLPYITAFILIAIDLIGGVDWFVAGVYLDEAEVYRFQPVKPYADILLASSAVGLLVLLGILIVAFVRERQLRFAISLLFGSIVVAMAISLISVNSPFLSGITHTLTTLPIMLTLGYIVLRTPLLTPTRAALDLALQATDDAVAVLDPDHQVVYVNPAAGTLGITLGQSLTSLADPAADTPTPDQSATGNRSRRFHLSERSIIINRTDVVNRRGKTLGTLLLGRDVTDLEQRTEQLACERERLAATVQQLEVAQQERLQLLATLQAGETRFRTLVESMDDIIFTLDHEQRHTGVFGHWLERYGLPPEAFLGKTPRETSPDSAAVALHETANARALRGEYVVYEWSFGDPPTTIQTSLSPMRDDSGNIIGIVGVGRDISPIKQMEAALRAGEERYRSIIETMHDGFVLHDADGTICEWNRRAENILGLTGAQLQGRTSVDPRRQAIHPDGQPFPGEAHPAMVTMRTGQPCFQVVMGIRKPDETHTWLLINSQPLFTNGMAAPNAVFTTFMDITKRKEMEEALRLNEQRYRALVESSEDAIFQIDPAGTYLFVNMAGARTMELTPAEIIGRHVSDLFPADAARLSLHFLETVLRTTQPLQVERPLPVNGTMRDYSTVLVPLLDDNEQVTSVVGIGRDMTERKQAEEALRMSRARLRAIFDNAAAGIALAGTDDHFLEVNQGWIDMLGYTAAEAGALTPRDIVHPDDILSNQAQIEALKHGETAHFSSEQRLVRKDGSIFWGNVSVTPISGSQGNIEAFIAIITDITERKRAEAALQQTNAELILLSEMSDLLQTCRTEAEAATVIAQVAPQLFPDLSGALYTISASRTQAEAIAVWGTLPVQRVCAPHACWSLRRGRRHLSYNDQPGLVCLHLPDPLPESALCYPMIAQGETLGIFHLCREVGPLSEATQQLATTTAEHLSLALANVRLRETLRHQAIRDPLTGLFNRRYMEESLERELHRAARHNIALGVIMLDLDHFKRFNDTFGHAAGDTILRELGNLLHSQLRGEDIACRYGGEEFALIILDAPLAVVIQRAEQLRAAVRQLNVTYREQSLGTVTLSLGVAVYPDHGITTEELLRAADTALYQAKAAGRNCVVTA
jgi:diguanylate cyclase (GGDEF)-like protein/PAS domain S-box-containing protein